ncbi:prepilin peptidase [Paenibacillus sp. P22]|uniref:prepilin peptidase n=1 Tax=Paenibacillus sp. P22 TaxID=483908 RepID=UPI0003F78CD1|nr:prepilin peptidase [Paenibacillus sp. P22]CDN42911.1 hypothetical protein BN871_CC_00060 [Paenibacillus sp. P22]
MPYVFMDGFILLLLLLCSVADIRWRRIPNKWLLLLLLAGIGRQFLSGTPLESLPGILLPSLPLLLLRSWLGRVGAGDIKLLAATGAAAGWLLNLYVFLAACLLALACAALVRVGIKRRIVSVPFAPFVLAAFLSLYAISYVWKEIL